MGVEYTLTCDKPELGDWDSTTVTGTPPNEGVIETVTNTPGNTARTGPRYIHAVSNGGIAYVTKDSWATPMTSLGDMRAVGLWARLKAYPTVPVTWISFFIAGSQKARLGVNSAGAVRAIFSHSGGTGVTTYRSCFAALNTWYMIQFLLIRSATVGGVQIYCDDALLSEKVDVNTDAEFDGAMTSMNVGAQGGDATFDMDYDAFRVGNSADDTALEHWALKHCRPPPGRGSRMTLGVGH